MGSEHGEPMILNLEGKGWPHAATYVIDPKGFVRWKFIEVDYRRRLTHEEILQALENAF